MLSEELLPGTGSSPLPVERLPLFRRVAIVGFGAMGSSFARALRRLPIVDYIVAADQSQEVMSIARELELADETTTDPANAVKGADIVVLGTPVGAYAEIMQRMVPCLSPGAILTDLASVKRFAITQIAGSLPANVHFVPAHPIAGTEMSGPRHGNGNIFEGRLTVLTPQPGTDRFAIARIEAMWRALGSRVCLMDPDEHDMVVAITSHVPHLLQFAVVGAVEKLETTYELDLLQYSAGGFRDSTRIAASDPDMWRDIFLANKHAVLSVLDIILEQIGDLRREIADGNGKSLHDKISRARARRRKLNDSASNPLAVMVQEVLGIKIEERLATLGEIPGTH